MRRFFLTAITFCAGLLLTLLIIDASLSRLTATSAGRDIIGREVYAAQRAARAPSDAVTTLTLGDSVARQLFRPGAEPTGDQLYLTSNFAISLAGQHYFIEDALAHHPNVRQVDLVLVPGAWQNDLDTVFTDDYFCGFFHTPAQVADVFRLKRDWRLSTAHAARWLLPNLLAHNAARRPQAPLAPTTAGHPADPWVTPPAGEPLLALLQRLWPSRPGPSTTPVPPPAGEMSVRVSSVSRHYLARMRALCAARGVRLRVIPGPCPDTVRYHDGEHLYDGELFYLDATRFSDGIHIKPQFLDAVRRELASGYQLSGSSPPRSATTIAPAPPP